MPLIASSSDHARFTSTRIEMSEPSACLIARTCSTSSSTRREPILSLKILWRLASIIFRPSAISFSVSPDANTQSTGKLSRKRPPNTSERGKSKRCA